LVVAIAVFRFGRILPFIAMSQSAVASLYAGNFCSGTSDAR
jgi:hypothetical protein